MKLITKYDYLQFKRCSRLLTYGLTDHQTEGGNSALKVFLTAQGRKVGRLAQELFKGQICHSVDEKRIHLAVLETKDALLKTDVLFEGAFEADGLVTRPDILDLKKSELIEIKSTTEIKDEHLLDVAFQKVVLSNSGLEIKTFKLGHISGQYLFDGTMNLNELFVFTDVTQDISQIVSEIKNDLPLLKKIFTSPELPPREIGPQCFSPEPCSFKEECFGEIVSDTIFTLRRDCKGLKYELHQAGIHSLKDIPEYVGLTKFQTLQKEAEIQNCAIINQTAITEALHEVTYPISFLDFESFNEAIPRYPKTTPYQQIPFQASLHVLSGLKHKLKHYSFLHTEDSDPRVSLARFLVKHLGESGTIIAYHASFEIARLFELIKVVPELEAQILALIERVWDLETIFEKGFYVHPDFKGSTSIKKVLPVMCPELSYDDLEINNGSLASVSYLKMISPETCETEKQKIKTNLELYCTQDTYAMYAVFKKLLMEVL